MDELTLAETMQRAHEVHVQHKRWHFHLYTPDCHFNPQKNRYLLVVENETDEQTFGFYADNPCMEQDRELVELLHGSEITRGRGLAKDNDSIQEILDRARDMIAKGIYWHHHVFPPACAFNRHRGKYTLAFEDTEERRVIESVTDLPDEENQSKVEALYYQQKSRA